jgi:hypothetical protein
MIEGFSPNDQQFVLLILHQRLDIVPDPLRTQMNDLFDKLDKDKNGSLQADDFKTDNEFANENLQKIWQKILHCCDFNDDKQVEKFEFTAHFILETLLDCKGQPLGTFKGFKQLQDWHNSFSLKLQENINQFQEDLKKA